MKRIILLFAVIVIFFMANTARAQFQVKLLDDVASAFASRPVTISCRTENEDFYLFFAMGYVNRPVSKAKFAVIQQDFCIGALAIDLDVEEVIDLYKTWGVMVLIHESYHLRHLSNNGNEALTQCRAMKHYDYALVKLGAESEVIDRLMPKMLENHFNFVKQNIDYYLPRCKTPERYDKWLIES